jgi:hypothetical protein
MASAPCHRAGTAFWARLCLALLGALLLCGVLRPVDAQVLSAPIYNPANGHWYQAAEAPNWFAARAAADTFPFGGYRGHLATINSAEENLFITNVVLPGLPQHNSYWLGGYQDRTAPDYREPAGGWRWVTGEPWIYANWNGGEPNNVDGGENALEIRKDGTWNDTRDQIGPGGYLIEYEPSPFPVAAAAQIVPQAVIGGTTAAGQVTLSAPAGPGGALLWLVSSNPAVGVSPATVTVLPGTTAAFFPVVTFPVAVPTTIVISVSGYGVAATASLQVLPTSVGFPPGNLLINGSFEEPFVPSGLANLTLRRIDELPGWRLLRGTVDVVPDPAWQQAPGQGRQSLDLVGTPGAATIEQSFVTQPGRVYLFSGWLAHAWGIPEGRANVFLNGQYFAQLFHSNALYGTATAADMRWQRFAYTFQALAPLTTLALADVTGIWDGGGGLVLDGLAVTPADASFPPPTPGTPANLTVRPISSTQVELSWLDTTPDETGFEIQRRTVGSDWLWIALVTANSTRFTDYGVVPGATFTYRVRAQNAQGPSAWSNEASVTPFSP